MNSSSRLIVLAAIAWLLAWLFFDALFGGGMFCFRDAAHYYYPLLKFVAEEWGARRVPLWNPYENLGQPLAGNPTAGVFYPGKLVFALSLSYPWAYKTYILGHLLLAAAAAYRLARHFQASVPAAGVCAISYAFSGNVLFQYCNVVFLVGAAWLPLAVLAADRMLRERRGTSAVLLGIVLAMMVLGGDPQMAYHAGLLAGLYALLLWVADIRCKAATSGRGFTFGGSRLALLALAAVVALVLSAVQVLPSVEFVRRSDRVPAGMTDRLLGRLEPGTHHAHTYEFSVGPWRLAEYVWPNVAGRQFPVHRRWLEVIPAEGRLWTPSLYMGILPLLLALAAMRFRRRAASRRPPQSGHGERREKREERGGNPETARSLFSLPSSLFSFLSSRGRCVSDAVHPDDTWVRWLSWSAVLAMAASFGWYGLGWLLREVHVEAGVGPPFGGLYWLMDLVLPGYARFRYPAKLLVVAALGLSVLAAHGWDETFVGKSNRVRRWLVWLGGISVAGAIAAAAIRPFWDGWLAGVRPDVLFGPLDTRGAFRDLLGALLQTAILCGAFWWLLRRAAAGKRWCSSIALLLVAADLAVANGWMVVCAPARLWEEKSRLAAVLLEKRPQRSPPCRVYRHPIWMRPQWKAQGSADRLADATRFDRDTLWPKYNLAGRIAVAEVHGSMILADYEQFLRKGHCHDVAEYVILPGGKRLPGGRQIDVDVADATLWHNPRHLPRAWIERPGEAGAAELCRLLHYDPLQVEIEAELAEPGMVVLSDQFYPGWKLEIDGEPAPIVRVKGVMRGVQLPAGSHRLIYRYRPASVLWGAIVSLCGWAALALLVLVRKVVGTLRVP